jgi:HK97 family phage major capsid protein
MVDSHGDPIMLLRGSRDLGGSTEVESLLGFPVTIDQAFSSYAPAAATAAGVFGNLREGYVRRVVREVQMVADPYSRSRYRQTEISAWARMDAVQQNPSAYTVFGGKA